VFVDGFSWHTKYSLPVGYFGTIEQRRKLLKIIVLHKQTITFMHMNICRLLHWYSVHVFPTNISSRIGIYCYHELYTFSCEKLVSSHN
jgi:hypothetical protein